MNDDMIILQTDHVTSSARVRDNQRRSRARRKEYTLGLEERLRRFESLGVEVTREVQAAGRKVAAENALLWSLLRHHGVMENEVGEYLKSKTSPNPPPCLSVVAPESAVSRLTTALGDHQVNHLSPQSTPFNSGMYDLKHEMNSVGNSFSPPNSVIIRYGSPLNGQASSADQTPDASSVIPKAFEVQHSEGKHDAGQAMSCETAARIVSTFRGYPEMQGLRSELGCLSESKCMVKNMDIFEMLDR